MILAGTSVQLRNRRARFPSGRPGRMESPAGGEELTGGTPSSAPPLQASELQLVPQQPRSCSCSPFLQGFSGKRSKLGLSPGVTSGDN